MSQESSGGKKFAGVSLSEKPHPAIVAVIIVAVLLLVIWWANLNGLFPGVGNWKAEQERKTMYSLAQRVGGDYSKLTPAEQKWVEETAHGRGRMAIGMYSTRAGQNSPPPVTPPTGFNAPRRRQMPGGSAGGQ